MQTLLDVLKAVNLILTAIIMVCLIAVGLIFGQAVKSLGNDDVPIEPAPVTTCDYTYEQC